MAELEDGFRAAFRLELRALGMDFLDSEQPDQSDSVLIHLSVRCEDQNTLITLEYADWSIERRSEGLSSPGRARLLALLASEMVELLFSQGQTGEQNAEFEPAETEPPENEAGDQANQEPPGPTQINQEQQAVAVEPVEPEQFNRIDFSFGGVFSLGGDPVWPRGGLDFLLKYRFFPWFGIAIDARAGFGGLDVSLGRVRILLLSFGLRAVFSIPFERVSIGFFVGARIGPVLFEGVEGVDGVVSGALESLFSGGLFGGVQIQLNVTDQISFVLRGEGGYLTWSAGAKITETEWVWHEGPWFFLSLGINFAFL